jgi:lipid-A-disaccharide synthase
MFVILPFEKEFYKKFDYEVDFVGHPLLDALSLIQTERDDNFNKEMNPDNKPIVALLPGSRRQEISVMLPLMLSVIPDFPEYRFIIGAAPSVPAAFYSSITGASAVPVLSNGTYDLLRHSTAALVTSGTATLETALFEVPEVVCYKGGWISYRIARALVKVNFISLVNLIMQKEVVRELIQQELKKENLVAELKKILYDKAAIAKMKEDYRALKEKLGGGGASAATARLIWEYRGAVLNQ